MLVAYHDHLKQLKDITDYAQRDAFATANQFIDHLAEMDLIDRPGKLRSKSLVFSVKLRKVETFDLDDLRTIYHYAVDQCRLETDLGHRIGCFLATVIAGSIRTLWQGCQRCDR
jgi:hypothetical protein